MRATYNGRQMRKTAAVSVLALAIAAAGCYNNPHVSERMPGEGRPGDTSRGPSVGPGTIPGGSTAGPQPPRKAAGDHAAVEPTHSGAQPAQPGLDHAGKAEPSVGHSTAAPKGDPAQTGNQPGVGRRTEEPKKH
jgi:hypothetical protein